MPRNLLWTPHQGLPDGLHARNFLREQRQRDYQRWRHIRDPRVDLWKRNCLIDINSAAVVKQGVLFDPTVTQSFTVNDGLNRVLLVMCAWQADTTEPTCTFNSISMTKVGPSTSQSNGGKRVNAFQLTDLNGLTTTTADVVLTSGQAEFGASMVIICLNGVTQATPTADWSTTPGTGTSTTPQVNVSNVLEDDWTFDVTATVSDGSGTPSFTENGGQIKIADTRISAAGGAFGVSYDSASTGVVNNGYTIGLDDWVCGGFRVVAIPALYSRRLSIRRTNALRPAIFAPGLGR